MLQKIVSTVFFFTMLSAEESYFTENLYEYWNQSLSVSEKIFQSKTEKQDFLIFQNPMFGKTLALDGVIQLTEADETIYHEMLTHVPMFAHENPTSVLIIGGGNGGVLREALKHPSVQRAVVVEMDKTVIDTSKQYFPKLSNGAFDDARAKIIIEDAATYVKHCKDLFDIIICDDIDPKGQKMVLFLPEFYGNCKKLLHKNGIFVNQSGVPFVQKEKLLLTCNGAKEHFKHVTFFLASIPSYMGGPVAFGFASDKKHAISEVKIKEKLKGLNSEFFYYNPKVHKAAFALPQYMQKVLEKR